MACVSGYEHTITVSNDGTIHGFGTNSDGELGLGHNKKVLLPTPIPNLPKINMIFCGAYFTVCVDCEGFIWSFGDNSGGQLGTGDKTSLTVPQKLLNLHPVLSVACGPQHTLIITNDSSLWSCGTNYYGQLCHGDKIDRLIPQKTSFADISKVSTGYSHSLFQNNKGEIFACGYIKRKGLGHENLSKRIQITPSLIPNLPPNIVQFVCGSTQSLFLDSEGNVFSFGDNSHGQLGLGHYTDQNELNKISNIPPIKIISCGNANSYLVDVEGNLWSFGNNQYGQLGHGDKTDIDAPKIIHTLKDIQQISYGCCGQHFFAKNSQNQIFAIGNNSYGQLGTGDTQSVLIPKEINSQYSTIWRDEFPNRAKSARK